MAAHPTIPARRIPRTEDPARLQSTWSQRVRHVLMYILGGVIRLCPRHREVGHHFYWLFRHCVLFMWGSSWRLWCFSHSGTFFLLGSELIFISSLWLHMLQSPYCDGLTVLSAFFSYVTQKRRLAVCRSEARMWETKACFIAGAGNGTAFPW